MTTQVLSRTRTLWLWVAAALILDIAGAQHVYTQPSLAAAALAALVIGWLMPDSLRRSERPVAPTALLLALLPSAALVAAMVDVAAFIPLDSGWTPTRLALLIGGGALLVALAIGYSRGRRTAGTIALTALVLGTLVRLIHMRHIAIAPVNGDMLPLVQGALDNLLAGRSPYMTYRMPWDVPLTYLPVTWLSYLPTYLLRLDLRWTNIAAEIVIGLALLWLSARRGAGPQTGPHGASTRQHDDPTLVLWAWLYLQPSVIHWDIGNSAPITWALLAMTLALVLAGSDRGGAVALGLTAAGTPLAAVFGPFIGLYWLRQRGLAATLRLVLLSAIVAAILVVPFLLWAPGDFINGTYRWFNTLEGWPRQKWLETDPHIWEVITGFSGEFWSRGREGWLKPIQAVIVLGVAGLYWLRGARADLLGRYAAAAYLGFMLFNPVLWPYLYNPALIVALVGLGGPATAYTTAPQPMPVADSRSQPTFS